MREWLQDLWGIHDLKFALVRGFDNVNEKHREITQRIGELEELLAEEKLSTQRTQKALQLVETQLDALLTAVTTRLPVNEANEIEKDIGDGSIAVTDDTHIPIVSGMKVRFETEGVETDIHID